MSLCARPRVLTPTWGSLRLGGPDEFLKQSMWHRVWFFFFGFTVMCSALHATPSLKNALRDSARTQHLDRCCDAVSFHADGRVRLCAFVRAKHKTCVNASLRLVGEKHDSQRIRRRLKEQEIEMQRLQQLFHLRFAPNSSEEAISCDEGVAVALWCRLCSRPLARRWFVEDDGASNPLLACRSSLKSSTALQQRTAIMATLQSVRLGPQADVRMVHH